MVQRQILEWPRYQFTIPTYTWLDELPDKSENNSLRAYGGVVWCSGAANQTSGADAR